MTYSIVNDKLVGPNVSYVDTVKKRDGKLKRLFLVIHYTASDNYRSDVDTLSSGPRQASCHLVVAPDGKITQVGDFNDLLWHAGESSWKGYVGLNAYSIGIEVTCPGPVDGDQARYASLKDGEPYHFTMARHRNGGPERKWALYTDEQLDVLREIGAVIMQHYGMKEAVGHDQIAPKRKIDPGPSAPDSLMQWLNGDRDDGFEPERPDLPAIGEAVVTGVAPDTLTFRVAPNGDARGALVERQTVEVLGAGGTGNKWTQVRTPAGHVGWVYGKYLVPS